MLCKWLFLQLVITILHRNMTLSFFIILKSRLVLPTRDYVRSAGYVHDITDISFI